MLQCGACASVSAAIPPLPSPLLPSPPPSVENKDHCDFVKLRTMLIRWANDLCATIKITEADHEIHARDAHILIIGFWLLGFQYNHQCCILHRTHMQDLKDYTQDVHYENFRKKKLLQTSPG